MSSSIPINTSDSPSTLRSPNLHLLLPLAGLSKSVDPNLPLPEPVARAINLQENRTVAIAVRPTRSGHYSIITSSIDETDPEKIQQWLPALADQDPIHRTIPSISSPQTSYGQREHHPSLINR